MNAILWWSAQNAITIAILIAIVSLTCRLFRDRPAVQHVLWAVVLLKFVTPPVVSWPMSVERFWPARQSRGATDRRPDVLSTFLPSAKTEHRPGHVPREFGAFAFEPAADPARSLPTAAELARASVWPLCAVWILGTAVCGLKQSRRIARHARLVSRASDATPQLTAEIGAIARQMGMRPPRAIVAREIASPFVWFLGRLKLVWPEMMSNREAVNRARGVIAHELAHLRRGDHVLAWIELVVGLLWWWNPMFWFVRRRVRESAELACDAIALGACPDGRRTYAEILLELSTVPGPAAAAPALGMSSGSTRSFERRLSMILSDRVSGKMSALGTLAAVLLTVAALPGWSFAQKATAPTGENTPRAEPDAGVTAARIRQIESELKRLSTVLERSADATGSKPTTAAQVEGHVAEKQPSDANDADRIEQFRRRLSRLGYFSNAAPPPHDETGRGHSTIRVGRGQNRIYILNIEQDDCFLSALTDHAFQVWYRAFRNPMKGDGFQQVWRDVHHSRPLAGDWTIEESKDQKFVEVSWAGTGLRINTTFDTAQGNLLKQDIVPAVDALQLRAATQKLVEAAAAAKDAAGAASAPNLADRLRALNLNMDGYRGLVDRLLAKDKSDDALAQSAFHAILNREATADELAHAVKYLAAAKDSSARRSALQDIIWAMINSREFQATSGAEAPGPITSHLRSGPARGNTLLPRVIPREVFSRRFVDRFQPRAANRSSASSTRGTRMTSATTKIEPSALQAENR